MIDIYPDSDFDLSEESYSGLTEFIERSNHGPTIVRAPELPPEIIYKKKDWTHWWYQLAVMFLAVNVFGLVLIAMILVEYC